jgi:alkylhydroperoxidase family enzyme
MHLHEVEKAYPPGEVGDALRKAKAAGQPFGEILHLISYKPEVTRHLLALTQAVMRGESPLSPGLRELIAAFTSRGNGCHF